MAAVLGGGWYANESGNRPLVWAVAGSLMFHLVLLFVLPLLQASYSSRVTPPPITARLAKPKPPEMLPSNVEPRVQPQRRPDPQPAPAHRAAPQQAPSPRAPILSAEPARQVAEPAYVLPAPPPSAPVAVPSPAAVAKAETHPSAPAAPESGTLQQYRLEIMDLARRYKKYPRTAINNNWVGKVEVRMVVGSNGAIASLAVKSSSGYAVLDQEALAMMRTAKSRATIPPALRGREIVIEVPVIFDLKDE